MLILAGILIMVGAILPSLAWLVFFLKEDVHPEPRRLIVYVLSLGALSTIPALLVQFGIQELLSVLLINLPAVVLLAFSEELFKFLAAWLGVRKNPSFDEPIDAMVYMVAAALGFAMIENLFVIGSAVEGISLVSLLTTVNILILRFVGATLLHVLSSAFLGFYWAKKQVIFGLFAATLVHSAFNYLVLLFPNNNLLYAALLLLVAAFFVFQDFEKLKTV
ncbi:hypothetical protein A2116_01040 [Candidatus Jorgensenbacteria bacterium GWA1_49_17]|uniref:Protease PrsW n=2 Tax=Candidatus Joergenseniibacteriota TaxID=1752739 RepID=A0A1F6BMI7_9BACT|nr:MAG: hypothetical protein A2127_02750 [Candidatus Jorgensenbacteria bacterium GWC1_48_12]OGG40471.1 MAG: hypothetical protein A2116_01040 [Candidatus Jorgensenbacteria bacterium GWA1_49_17]